MKTFSMYKDRDSRRLREFITDDEPWLYFFEPDSRENNKVRVSQSNERPQIACRKRSVQRVCYIFTVTEL